MKIKVTISSEERIVMIPMEYDTESDALSISEIQIDPIPQENENINNDVVLNITKYFISTLNSK